MMHKINWQDLQYVLVVARSGSVSAAARTLGVNHSTVLRRINMLEERQGVRLFDRLRSGYQLNLDGQQLLQAAQSIEETVMGLERRIAGTELKLEGTIRVTTTDSVLLSVVNRPLAEFQNLYPDISIELTLTANILSLTKRDADIAIRPSRYEPERLIGKRVSDFVFGIYCGSEYWTENSQKPFDQHSWLAPDDSMSGSPAGRWLQAELPDARVVFSADSFVALGDAASQNLGMTLLPCSQGDQHTGLIRVGNPLKEYCTGLWVLTHRDLLRSVRIRSFYDFMIEALTKDHKALTGDLD